MALAPITTVGDHAVTTGDLEAGDHLTLLQTHGPVALIYVDPPWGANWHTGFRQQAGQAVTTSYDDFLAALLTPDPPGGARRLDRDRPPRPAAPAGAGRGATPALVRHLGHHLRQGPPAVLCYVHAASPRIACLGASGHYPD